MSPRESGAGALAPAHGRLVGGSCGRRAGDRGLARRRPVPRPAAGRRLPDPQERRPSRRPRAATPTMSVSSTEMKFEHTNWPTANVNAADHRRRPDGAHAAHAVDHADQDQRDEQREQRRLAADHRAEVLLRQVGQAGERHDRRRDRAERHRRGVGHERDRGGLHRLEADRDQHHGGDRHRRAEAGQRLEQGAEAERDDHGLDPLVVGDRARTTAAAPRSGRSRRSCCRSRSRSR